MIKIQPVLKYKTGELSLYNIDDNNKKQTVLNKSNKSILNITMQNVQMQVYDCGDKVSRLISEILNKKCRLVELSD